MVRYRRRNVIRKVFDREVWVEDPALRRIQDTIFVQSILFGIVCGGLLTVLFVVVPGGGLILALLDDLPSMVGGVSPEMTG